MRSIIHSLPYFGLRNVCFSRLVVRSIFIFFFISTLFILLLHRLVRRRCILIFHPFREILNMNCLVALFTLASLTFGKFKNFRFFSGHALICIQVRERLLLFKFFYISFCNTVTDVVSTFLVNVRCHDMYVLNSPESIKIKQSIPLRATELTDIISSMFGFTVPHGVSIGYLQYTLKQFNDLLFIIMSLPLITIISLSNIVFTRLKNLFLYDRYF